MKRRSVAPMGPAAPPQPSEGEFSRFAQFVLQETGIALAPHKRPLLASRAGARLRDLGVPSFSAYLERVRDDLEERQYFIDRITTHETRFFREARHFAFLEQGPFRRWRVDGMAARRPKHMRFWSAGCSTGEEAYSIAMSARHHFPLAEGWNVEVVGTDVSNAALETARGATWSIDGAHHIPEPYRKAFMLRGTGRRASEMRASRELRELVRFLQVNLAREVGFALGSFDVIFCCNVLMYFDAGARMAAIDRLLSRLRPDGYLCLGHAESLTSRVGTMRSVAPNVYAVTNGLRT